jgi:hypothetical protein
VSTEPSALGDAPDVTVPSVEASVEKSPATASVPETGTAAKIEPMEVSGSLPVVSLDPVPTMDTTASGAGALPPTAEVDDLLPGEVPALSPEGTLQTLGGVTGASHPQRSCN